MQVKSLGPFGAGTSIGSERDEAVASVKRDSFVRAQPPQAAADTSQDEIKQGLLRMADYLHKLQGKKKRKKKRSASALSPHDQKQRALRAYEKTLRAETGDESKGLSLSLFA